MFIHNFYSDLLISTRVLFDNYIFQYPNYIKKYEFNYGNRVFQLDPEYKTNYEFPVILVNLNNPTPTFGQRYETLKPIQLPNVNHTPVLYNLTNNKILYVQEEQTNVSLSVTINCESQFQAREIEHVLLRYLPLNKFINLYSFTSFLEISNTFLNKNFFDINNHKILNLFDKMDNNTGEIEHFFSIQYSPLLRNESLTANITDSTQRSFQVTLELTFNIQLPIFLFDDTNTNIEAININLGNFGGEFISDYPVLKLIRDKETYDDTRTVKKQLLFSDPGEIIEQDEHLTRIVFKPDPEFLKLYDDYTYNFINNNRIFKNVEHEFIEQENKVIFDFPTTYFDETFKIDYTKPFILQIVEPFPTKSSCRNNIEIGT